MQSHKIASSYIATARAVARVLQEDINVVDDIIIFHHITYIVLIMKVWKLQATQIAFARSH